MKSKHRVTYKKNKYVKILKCGLKNALSCLADIEENKPIKLYNGSTSIDLAKTNLNASVQNISTTFNALQRENWK